jgi:hypothetical protein
MLTSENYSRGFLVDDELMGGVTAHPEQVGTYVAFVLRHTTGEYLGYQPFPALEPALAAINGVRRAWTFEKVGGCGSCGKGDGSCGGRACAKGGCAGSC